MPTIRHILAATDLSASARHAVDRGFGLAAATGARLTLAHTLGPDALAPLRALLGSQADDVVQQATARQREALEALARDPARPHGVAVDIRLENGAAGSALPALAATTGADLMVLGARGDNPLRRMVLGSTATRVLRHSPCPVLLARQPDAAPYRRVLLPIDFSPASALQIRLVRTLAPQAGLVLLHGFEAPFEGLLRYASVSADIVAQYRAEARERALQQLRALAAAEGLREGDYTSWVGHGEAVGLITAQQERLGCDLIAMGKHGTHVTEELLLGSVTRRVLDESDADLLVVVEPQRPAVAPA